MRHDIDYCVDKALEFAILEHEMGISSTYFVLVTSDFYNIFSLNNSEKLRRIRDQIHIGENGFIGLGAVVTGDVDNKVVVGVPAKVVRAFRLGDK